MQQLMRLMEQARQSKLKMWLLNRVMAKVIPFNARHGFKLIAIDKDSITSQAKYQKRNFNHIKGIHACGIATIGEFSAGMMLIRSFDVKTYRIIMSHLDVRYHYQAKKDLRAIAKITAEDKQALLEQLQQQDAVFKVMTTEVYDSDDNHVATVSTEWQLKPWSKVRTKA